MLRGEQPLQAGGQGGEKVSRSYLSTCSQLVKCKYSVDTNDVLTKDVSQRLANINQSMTAVYQALPGRGRMGRDSSGYPFSQLAYCRRRGYG